MPIGSSKLGVLGAGLVPGGSVTFNTSGNWPVPPGVKKVSITGKGGTGNPGNPGNSGNAGNAGGGGGGGAGGQANSGPCGNNLPARVGGAGGNGGPGGGNGGNNNVCANAPPVGNAPLDANPGNAGNSGNAGSAGSAGNPGNAGQTSSAIGNNFAGGAGGNGGTAGAAGNGGTGGQGGNAGTNLPTPVNYSCNAAPGNGGNGGGAGMSVPASLRGNLAPNFYPTCPNNFSIPGGAQPGILRIPGWCGTGLTGGGGAGDTNNGQTASASNILDQVAATGIKSPGVCMPLNNSQATSTCINPANGVWRVLSILAAGGTPGGGRGGYGNFRMGGGTPSIQYSPSGSPGGPFTPVSPANLVVSAPQSTQIVRGLDGTNARAGGGGGGSGYSTITFVGQPKFWRAGAGGGGGRGNAGNAGGAGGAGNPGAAATPQTFNCVNVTPGATVPITVGSPGGQIVISWNPQ
jgi:hypothetical protein